VTALWVSPQATLARLGIQNNTLADLVYIADKVFLNRPSPRLQVRCTRPQPRPQPMNPSVDLYADGRCRLHRACNG